MNLRSCVGFALALLVALPGLASAGSPERLGTSGALELRLPVGSRSVALSGSNVGGIGGAEALFYNPAGILTSTASTEAMFDHTTYIADMNVNYFAVTHLLGEYSAIGVSAKVLSLGSMVYTTEAAPDGNGQTFEPTFSTLGITYARKMTNRVDFGGTLTYAAEHIMQETAAGVSFSFGFQYDADYRGLKLGMVMSNLGPNMQFRGTDLEHLQQLPGYNPNVAQRGLSLTTAEFELPTTFQFGGSYPVYHKGQNDLTIHGVFINNSFAVDEGRGGIEYTYQKMFSLRAGGKLTSNKDDLFGVTYGLGVKAPIGGSTLWIDYASQPVSKYFDDVQHLSATFMF
jgi:hypothetical protein